VPGLNKVIEQPAGRARGESRAAAADGGSLAEEARLQARLDDVERARHDRAGHPAESGAPSASE
jgi:hypothetical protein